MANYLLTLPDEMLFEILDYLDAESILNMEMVCDKTRSLVTDPIFARKFWTRYMYDLYPWGTSASMNEVNLMARRGTLAPMNEVNLLALYILKHKALHGKVRKVEGSRIMFRILSPDLGLSIHMQMDGLYETKWCVDDDGDFRKITIPLCAIKEGPEFRKEIDKIKSRRLGAEGRKFDLLKLLKRFKSSKLA